MTLPASFLAQAESHGCFSGCFGHEARFEVCLNPHRAPDEIFAAYCKDCLSYRIGVLKSLLPPGNSAHAMADAVTAHNRHRRGFAWSFSGYHAVGPGFWLTAAYYANGGVFLLNGARSRSVGSDLDLLILAFQYGVASLSHPRMTDASEFTVRECHVDFSTPPGAIQTVQDLFASPQCSLQPKRGYQRITVAEFHPIASQAAASPHNALAGAPRPRARPPASSANAAPRQMGVICPVCLAEIRERALFTGSYVGCLCD